VPKAILAPKDQFDKEWDNYLNEMNKAGLPKVTDEINRLLQEKLELWGVE
jgi:putative aldouronate transport system substrate-binding protein